MKNKAFISIYVLLILSIISLSLGFIYKQSLNNQDLNNDIYNKKKTVYKLESLNNIALSDKKRLKEFLEEVDKNDPGNKIYSYKVDYIGDDEKLSVCKTSDNNFLMEKEILYKNVRAQSYVYLELLDKYNLNKKSKIILADDFDEFFKSLEFREEEFKKYDKLDLDKGIDTNIKVKDKLLIKGDSHKLKKDNLSNESDDHKSLDNFNDKSKTCCKINGIVIIDGDLILEKDLDIEGLLIISGDIVSIDGSNLSLNGQIIAKNDFDIDYTYNKKRVSRYIDDIKNPKLLKIKSKKVY